MSLHNVGWVAGGTIRPSRFVKSDTSNNRQCLEADANDLIIGVSQEGTRDAPGVTGAGTDAASDGEPIQVYGQGDTCLVEAGDAITAGDVLKSDADGKAVPVTFLETAITHHGAIALEARADGELVPVQVIIGFLKPA